MPNIDIQLKPSKTAILLSLILWLSSIIAVISLHIPYWIVWLLLFVLFLYGLQIFFRHGLLIGPKALRGLRHISGKHWQISMNQGDFMGILMGDSTVTLKFCVLRFQIPDKRFKYSCLLFHDSFEFDTYRRLLLRLRCFKSMYRW